ncbi:1-acyl-sn-glycerol-3-phosphate acyltransferases [Spirosomataceae bacterium TFI 002]|nr:1-acyl-sn-glycerol-3-phosphate acyltransferases [Spirosomataceae bacterium TFI 002]
MINSIFTSLYYYPLKLCVTITNLLYFKKVQIQGLNNIPAKGPVIYAITHQNSLLDAYLSNGFSWRSPYYLVRADIYKHKVIDKFMRGIKTLPIYRIRDGYDSVKKNDQIFDLTKEILAKGGVVAIFPEGSHSMTHQLRPLKKGIARIAFMAEADENFALNVQIVPIGINYESYFKSSGRTLVSIGKPIKVADYKQCFIEDQNRAFRSMLSELSVRMKSLIVHIDKANYDNVFQDYKNQRVYKNCLTSQLQSDQELVNCLQKGEQFEGISDKISTPAQWMKSTINHLRFVLSYIPKNIVRFMVHKMVRDKNFIGTMRYTYSMLIYPLFYTMVYFSIKTAMEY